MTIRIQTTEYGEAALKLLRDVVFDAKRDDPMTPVTVIVPNNIAGIVARRHLAYGSAGRPGGAGIEVVTLVRLAERLGTPTLGSSRPTSQVVLAAAIRRALEIDPGLFRDVADHPGTVRALARTHGELRDVSDSARRAVAAASSLGAALVAVDDAVTTLLEPGWYDVYDVLTTAAEHLTQDRPGTCMLYLPQALTNGEARFVTALAAAGELTVIAGLTYATRADEVVARTLRSLSANAFSSVSNTTADQVIVASDSDDEVRCVVRDLLTALQQTPAHRIAVLYCAPIPYARLLHEHLAAAGVTVNGAGVRAVDERAVARLLLETLALADGDVPRAALFQALANASVRDFTNQLIPISTWERTSRSAGVVGGNDWTARLDAYMADRAAHIVAEQTSDDPQDWLIDRHRREAQVAGRLQEFTCRLRDELRSAADMTTWAELATWCRDLFTALGDC